MFNSILKRTHSLALLFSLLAAWSANSAITIYNTLDVTPTATDVAGTPTLIAIGQRFMAPSDGNLTSITLDLGSVVPGGGSFDLDLFNDGLSGGNPAPLADLDRLFRGPVSGLTAGVNPITFTAFPPLTASTFYWIVLTPDNGNQIGWNGWDGTPPYTGVETELGFDAHSALRAPGVPGDWTSLIEAPYRMSLDFTPVPEPEPMLAGLVLIGLCSVPYFVRRHKNCKNSAA